MKRPEIFVVLQRMFLPRNAALENLAERVDAYTDSIASTQRDKDKIEAALRRVAGE